MTYIYAGEVRPDSLAERGIKVENREPQEIPARH